jgi:hypothetical protein
LNGAQDEVTSGRETEGGSLALTLGLCLGDVVNILDGLTPGWYGHDRTIPVFAPLAHAPLVTVPLPNRAPTPGVWEGPRVTLHDSLAELVDALFDYRVIPSRDNRGQRPLPPSTLMLGGRPIAAVAGAIGNLVGIDVAHPDVGGFVLLELRRNDADHRHEVERGGNAVRSSIERYWTREGRHAMARLRWDGENVDPDGRRRAFVTPRQVPRYLDYFYARGTHFVARVGLGQRLFQVLACRADRYQFLREFWQRETSGAARVPGPLSVSFIQFTGPRWMCARGKLASIGNEPELARSIQQGAWRSDGPESAEILLAPFVKSRRGATAMLDRFEGSAATRVELLSQGYLMGEPRAQAWQKVLNGALLQRYGVVDGQKPYEAAGSPRRYLFGSTPRRAAFLDGRMTLLRDCIDAADLYAISSSEVREIEAIGLCLALGSGSVIDLPGERTNLLAFRTETGEMGANVPVLRVADEGFSRFAFSTGDMRGALVVTDRSETRRETYFRGLRFGFDGSGRVVVKDDPRQPSDAHLRDARELLEATLDMAEALLAVADAESADLARGHPAWLAAIIGQSGLLAEDEPDSPAWHALRARALCSAHLGVNGIEVARPKPEAMRELVVLANEAWVLGQHQPFDRDRVRQDDGAALSHLAARLGEAEEGIHLPMDPARSGARLHSGGLNHLVGEVTAARQRVLGAADLILTSLGGDSLDAAKTLRARAALGRLIDALCPQTRQIGRSRSGDWNDHASLDATQPLVEIRQGMAAIANLGRWLEHPETNLDATSDMMLQAVSAPARWPEDQTWQALIEAMNSTLGAVTARSDASVSSLKQALETLQRVGADAQLLLFAEVRRGLREVVPIGSPGFSRQPELRFQAHYWRLTRLLALAYALSRSIDETDRREPRPEDCPRLSLMEIAHALLATGRDVADAKRHG